MKLSVEGARIANAMLAASNTCGRTAACLTKAADNNSIPKVLQRASGEGRVKTSGFSNMEVVSLPFELEGGPMESLLFMERVGRPNVLALVSIKSIQTRNAEGIIFSQPMEVLFMTE